VDYRCHRLDKRSARNDSEAIAASTAPLRRSFENASAQAPITLSFQLVAYATGVAPVAPATTQGPRRTPCEDASTHPRTQDRLGSCCVAIELRSTAPHNSPSDGELSRPPAASSECGAKEEGGSPGGSLLVAGNLTDLRAARLNEVRLT
jgi:hypothetical protein